MLPLPIQTEALFDGTTGQHLGGIFPPLLANGELTDDYAACLSNRPAEQLIYYAPICPNRPLGSRLCGWRRLRTTR